MCAHNKSKKKYMYRNSVTGSKKSEKKEEERRKKTHLYT